MADLRLTIDASDVPKAISAVGGLERKITELARRYAQGSISQETYNRGLLQLKRNYERVGISSQKATSEVRRYAAAQLQLAQQTQQAAASQQRMAVATQATGRSMNRSGVLMQQTGYQVGDFIVQVQSGTNWMVAFGQQATQVAGTLTLLGGKFILLGSVLGIAIPLVTALGAAWMRTRDNTNEAADALQAAKDVLKDLEREIRVLEGGFFDNTDLSFAEGIDMEIESLHSLVESYNALNTVRGLSGTVARLFTQERIDATQEEIEALQQLRDRYLEISLERQREEGMAEAARLRAQAARDEADAILESAQAYEQRRQSLTEQIQLQQAIVEYGRESAEVIALQAQQARAAYEADLRRQGINETLISSLMEQYDILVQVTGEAEAAAAAIEQLGSLDTSNTVAAIVAITNALGVATAAAIDLARNLPGYTGGGISGPDAAIEQTREMTDQGENFTLPGWARDTSGRLVRGGGLPSRSTGGGGGGGGGGNSLESIIQQRMQQIQQERELLMLSEQQRQVREIAIEIENQYGQALTATQQAAVNAAAEQIAANERVLESQRSLQQAQEQLASSIASSFGDMFMSILDGTKSAKDAFKDMVKAVLQQLVRLFIIRPIMNSIQGLLGGGGGMFGAGGSMFGLAGFRASGGTMSPGGAYMVGEKGPELVVPGTRSTVMNNDLTNKTMQGGSPAPVVNMTYNFQGGVTEQDLARALPKLVEQTKRSVIDSVQRGGSVARVFK